MRNSKCGHSFVCKVKRISLFPKSRHSFVFILTRKAMILKICEIGGITPVELLKKSNEIDKKVEKMIEDFLGLPAKKQREFLEKIIAEEKKKEQNLK